MLKTEAIGYTDSQVREESVPDDLNASSSFTSLHSKVAASDEAVKVSTRFNIQAEATRSRNCFEQLYCYSRFDNLVEGKQIETHLFTKL